MNVLLLVAETLRPLLATTAVFYKENRLTAGLPRLQWVILRFNRGALYCCP